MKLNPDAAAEKLKPPEVEAEDGAILGVAEGGGGAGFPKLKPPLVLELSVPELRVPKVPAGEGWLFPKMLDPGVLGVCPNARGASGFGALNPNAGAGAGLTAGVGVPNPPNPVGAGCGVILPSGNPNNGLFPEKLKPPAAG